MNGPWPTMMARATALGLLLAGLAGAYWLRADGGIELRVEEIERWLAEVGPLAPLVFAGIVALRPLVLLPSGFVFVAAGILFGTAWGAVWATAGGTAGALLAFAIARGIGRDAIKRRLSGRAEEIDRYLGRRGAAWLAAYTALPLTPLTPAYYAAGLTSMRTAAFTLGAVAGLLPRTALYGFFGESVLSMNPVRILAAGAILLCGGTVAFVVRRRLSQRARDDMQLP